jgi:prepilin-type N-terminal cleavage/methylation domain-containing protein
MHDMKTGHRGFTLIEAMVVMAIIAVLGAISTITYRIYVERAAAADLVSAHHNIRNYIQGLGGKSADDCAALAASYERKLLSDPYARLDYGFEAVPGGFRPVLSVCATAQSDARNVPVARRAHDSFVNIGVMEKGAVLSDSVVSYALRLTDGEQALCKTAPASSGPACAPTQGAQPPAKPAQPAQAPAQPAQAPAQPAQPAQPANPPACAADQERVGGSCVAKCPADSPRDPSSGQCVPLCHDEYGPTCSQDFGDMCDQDYVREMCQKYCGVCVAPSGAAQGPAAQPAAVSPAVPQGVPANMVAGSAPGAPLVPKAVPGTIYPNQRSIGRTPEQWLNIGRGDQPGRQSAADYRISRRPGVRNPLAIAQRRLGYPFANPGVKAEGYVEITFENAAGRNTVRVPMRTGRGW